MSGKFDPYYRWLSIPPEEQPPHHYRLLSLKLFEADADVIESAADRQMKHVRDHQAGPHAADSQRLLNEIAAARVVLLDAERKSAYDVELRARLARARKKRRQEKPLVVAQSLEPMGTSAPLEAADCATATAAVEEDSVQPLIRTQIASKSSFPKPILYGAALCAVVLLLGVGALALWAMMQPPPDAVAEGIGSSKSPSSADDEARDRSADISETNDGNASPAVIVPPPTPPPVGVNDDDPDQYVAVADPRASDDDAEESAPVAVPPSPLRTTGSEPDESNSNVAQQKLPVPDKQARDKKRGEIVAIFAIDKARTVEEKGELAANLMRTARDTKDDPPAQFALLNLTREQAVEAGRIKMAFEAIDLLAEKFDFDADAVRVVSLQEAAKAAVPPAAKRDVVTLGMQLVDRLVARDEFDKAAALSERLIVVARPIRDAELLKAIADQRRAADALAADYRKAKAAFETLKTEADNPEANLVAGRYLAFIKQDWNKGLSHLARSSDPLLSAAAKLELVDPQTSTDQEKLADAWWSAAEVENNEHSKNLCRAHSGMWYRKAAPQLFGLAKAKAEHRISEAGALVSSQRDNPPIAGNTSSRADAQDLGIFSRDPSEFQRPPRSGSGERPAPQADEKLSDEELKQLLVGHVWKRTWGGHHSGWFVFHANEGFNRINEGGTAIPINEKENIEAGTWSVDDGVIYFREVGGQFEFDPQQMRFHRRMSNGDMCEFHIVRRR